MDTSWQEAEPMAGAQIGSASGADLFRTMLRIRCIEEEVGNIMSGGEIPGVAHLSIGQEAVAVHVYMALAPDGYITTTRADRRRVPNQNVDAGSRRFPASGCRRAALEINAAAISRFGSLDAATLLELVAQTRQHRYALGEERIIPGMSAVGVPILGRDAMPVAAFSVAAVSERMHAERRGNNVAWLTTEARAVEEQLRKVLGPISEPGVRGLLRRRYGRT